MNIFSFTEKMERGQYPINIPTSLALESLMNIHPERQWPKPPHLKYDEYWLSLRTLYRNVVGSYSSDINTLLMPGAIAELMHDEWEMIKKVITENSRLNPTLYLCNYKQIYTRYKHHTVFKGDVTEKQKAERKRMESSIKQFLHDVGDDYVEMFDSDITPKQKDGHFLIQTHIAFDLISYRNFEDMDLLESHTGAIKNRSLWYTKYNNGKDLSMIPFNQYFLRIFGDKEFFSPKDAALRKAIIEIAQKDRWNSLTTDSRVRMSLDKLQNPYFREVVKDMM
jgi:hypothetical protein